MVCYTMLQNGAPWCKYSKFFSLVVDKAVFIALVSLFLSQVLISYGKLRKRSVAYDQDVISSIEQLYPSFTLCPEYENDRIHTFKDVDNSMDKIFNYRKKVLNELAPLLHIVKSENG